jgi:hypothetical protein
VRLPPPLRADAWPFRLAQLWMRGLSAVAGITVPGMLSVLLGLNVWAGTPPIVELVRHNGAISLLAGCVLLLITFGAVVVSRGPGDKNPGRGINGLDPRLLRVILPTMLSTLSTGISIALVLTVLTRPAWCPTALGPPPELITYPGGIHDANLEIYFTALQSATFVIPGDPARYGLGNLPETIGALREEVPGRDRRRIEWW